MLSILLLILLFLTLWHLVKILRAYHQKQYELILTQENLQSYILESGSSANIQVINQSLLNMYSGVGQSLAALHIQLQVAQKLWHLNPVQAQKSLSEAYQLSSSLMDEVRCNVKILGQVDE
ncbi:MAG: histidine kinase dimerization/phosphoacceptor domain-containing protein [Calothrix sp. C42_A2020_038]|nr:histidine kinase dimerization/phosphoacceptor domain-containing protein [Calothrix sp. C42_A2020_038]